MWVKWYAYILEIILVTLNKLIYNSQNVCEYLALNEMLIKLASLIICSINDNFTNTTSTPPLEVKKKQYCICMDMFKKRVALRDISKIEKSQIFVSFENEASYEDFFCPQVF